MSKIFTFITFVIFTIAVMAQTPELVIPVGHHAITGVYDVDVSEDKKLAISLADEELKIWDFQTGALLKTWRHPKKIRYSRCQFTPDGKRILVSGGGTLTMINTETLTLERDLSGGIGSWHVLVSPDSKFAYTGDFSSGEIKKVNLISGEISQLFNWPKAQQVESLSLSADGSKLLLMVNFGELGKETFQSALISTTTGERLKTLPENEQYQKISPTGNLFKIAILDGKTEDEKIYQLIWVDPNTLKVIGQQDVKVNGYNLDSPRFLIFQYQFFPKSDRLIFSEKSQVFSVGLSEAAQLLEFSPTNPQFKHLQISSDGKEVFAGSTDNRLVKYDLKSKQLIRQFGMDVFSPTDVYAALNGKGFVAAGDDNAKPWSLSWVDGHARIQRLTNAKSRIMKFISESVANVSPDGTLVVWGTEQDQVQVAEARSINKIKKTFAVGNPYHVAISANNQYVIVSDTANQLFVCEMATGVVKPLGSGGFKWGITDETGRYFFGLDHTKDNDSYAVYIDLQLGKKLWEKTDKENPLGHYPFFLDQQEVGYSNSNRQFIVFINRQTGAIRKQDYAQEYFDKNPQLKKRMEALELNMVEGSNIRKSADVGQKGFFGVYAKFDDNAIKLYRTSGHQKLADVILSAKTDDWAILAPDGRFDASEGMLKQLYYTKGREIIALEALSEKYYTPNLLAQLFIEEPSPNPEPKKDDIKSLKSPPLTKILPPVDIDARNLFVADDAPALRRYDSKTGRIKLTVEASTENDGISEIRLFHNGKAVGTGTRNLSVEDDKLDRKKSQTFEIQLSDGDNVFRAISLNSQRTESRPDDIVVANKMAKVAVTQNAGSTLHLVIIGINQYKNAKYNLNYATADATAFKAAIESHSAGIFSSVNAIYIGDAQATKVGITNELEKVKSVAQAKDVFIFYYAGHGVMNERKEFFIVPHDVTQMYGADEALAQKGLSSALMQQYSREIKAQKQLFILDACQSAGALDQVAMRGAAEEKAIAQLARATGTHWLTASGSEQFASEFKQLGHGTFTYVLLEALSGKADKGSDRKITVKELDAYLQEVVPEVTAKYKGTAQYPASYGFGNDFPIGVVK